MSSYFTNSYIPDLRNGGGVEHPHQHQQHYGAAVQVPQQQQQAVQQQPQQASDPCDPTMLRQGGVPSHHYGAATGQQPGMPYPRFPPYDRMDIRNAAYYQQQQEHAGMDMAAYRSGSPTAGMVGHLGHTATPVVNGHPSTPIVYASCKLQAAAVDHQGSVLDGPDSPPLVDAQMHHQMHPQHPHMQAQQPHPQAQAQPTHQQQQQQPQQPTHLQQTQQQHLMYQQQAQSAQPQQAAMHAQQQQQHQGVVASPLGQQQPGAPQGAAPTNLPSPLYPWMRSQFVHVECRAREEARPPDVHALPDPRAREGVPLQPLPDQAAQDRDRPRPLPDRAPDQDLVPESPHEVEERDEAEGRAELRRRRHRHLAPELAPGLRASELSPRVGRRRRRGTSREEKDVRR